MTTVEKRFVAPATWVLGGWLFLSVAMAYSAGATFGTLKPDRLRSANEVFAKLNAKDERPQALRYVASELNRKFFRHYGYLQIGLAVLGVFFVFKTKHRTALILTFLSLALAAFFACYLIPEATALGREIDFTPKEPLTAARETFDNLHQLSTKSEGLKMILLIAASVLLLRSSFRE